MFRRPRFPVLVPIATAAAGLLMAAVAPAHAQTVGAPIDLTYGSAGPFALNAVTNKLYVARNSGPLTVIDLATRTQSHLTNGISAPAAIAVNSETNTVYVANAASGTITVLDGASDSLVTQTGVIGAGPWAIDTLGDRAYSARTDVPVVNVFAGRSYQVGSNPRSRYARAIAVNPVTRRAYVGFEDGPVHDLVAMDMTSPAPYPPLLCPDGAGGFQPQPPEPPSGQPDTWDVPCTGISASSIAVNPVTNTVFATYGFATDPALRGVRIIDGVDHSSVFVPVSSGQGLNVVAVNPVTNKIYAAGNQVFVIIDGASHAATAFPMHPSTSLPLGMAVNVLTNMVYVVDAASRLWTIDGTTGSTTIIALPTANIRGLALDATRDMLYVLEYTRVTPITGVPRPHAATGITTTITPLAGDVTPTATGTITLSASSSLTPSPLGSVRKVYYRVSAPGDAPFAWQEAAGSGPYTAHYSGLSRGVTYTLQAFATIGLESPATYGDTIAAPLIGNIAAYSFQTSDPASGPPPDLAISQSADMASPATGKDVVFTVVATNNGPGAASSVVVADTLPATIDFVWATPGCGHAAGTVTCNAGNLGAGASATMRVVGRPNAAGPAANSVNVAGAENDETPVNNTHTLPFVVDTSPAGNAQVRYRLYSPVTRSHLFTTDANEYATLGSQGWTQEGTAGKLLDNPGAFNGVTAVPYYRLYSPGFHWHHWTSDANEYYTLIAFPGWNGEGVDGYILPSATAGTTQLYRLNYPALGSLHHWTIDANEYTTLIGSYGWIGEGGAGFVIQ